MMDKKYSLKCDLCSMSFKKMRELKNHVALYQIRPITAKTKEFIVKTSASTKKTSIMTKNGKIQRIVPSRIEFLYKCEVCSLTYTKPEELVIHQREHAPVKLHCELCQRGFNKPMGLNMHKWLVHKIPIETVMSKSKKGKKEFSCQICSATFTTDKYLKRHMNFHSNNMKDLFSRTNAPDEEGLLPQNPEPFESLTTNEDSNDVTIQYEEEHNYAENSDNKTPIENLMQWDEKRQKHVCRLCNAAFKEKRYLMRHISLKKCDKYKCSWCSATFFYKQEFETHMLIHGEKPFKCDLCPYTSFRKDGLVDHLLMHQRQNVKLYECDVCDAKFAKPEYLIIHNREHTNDYVHKCDVCPAAFKATSGLTNHLRAKHGIVKTPEIPHENLVKYLNSLKTKCLDNEYYDVISSDSKFATLGGRKAPSNTRKTKSSKQGDSGKKQIKRLKPVSVVSKSKPNPGDGGKVPTVHQCHVCSATFSNSEWLEIHSSIHVQ